MQIGSRIKEICAERNISVAQLEREAGIPEKSISKWDKNIPSFDKVQKVLDALEISYDEFMNLGSSKHQKIQTALDQIRIADISVYDSIMRRWSDKEPLEDITENERMMLDLFRVYNDEGQKVILSIINELTEIESITKPPNID